LLDYHIIKKWKESRSALKFGDISGALEMVRTPDSYKTEFSKLKLKNNFIFRGNYWWTTTKYIKRLPDPKSLTSDRYINEDWIGLVPELKAVSVYSDNHDYYHMVANVNEYTIRNKNIWNIYTVDNIKGTVNNKEVQVTFKEP
jgi:hypothetical protein